MRTGPTHSTVEWRLPLRLHPGYLGLPPVVGCLKLGP